jgi:hypothetical protein
MDTASEQISLVLEEYSNHALKEFAGYRVKTLDEMFTVVADDDAVSELRKADQAFRLAQKEFDAHNYSVAERQLREVIRGYNSAVAAMKTCGHLCESLAMYGTTLLARGDVEEARVALIELLSLEPNFDADRKRFPPWFFSLRSQMGTTRSAAFRGNVVVKTRPAGARVYLGGVFQGYSPMTLQTLPVGRALVKIERPGYRQAGFMVDVTMDDHEIKEKLEPSPSLATYDGNLDQLAEEANREKGGSAMMTVGRELKLDRALITILREDEQGHTEISMAYFELATGKRLAVKRTLFQGDEYGQLKKETARLVNAVMNAGNGEKEPAVDSTDPLDHRQGVEDWSGDDRGGRGAAKDKKFKNKGDPLDRRMGTEDW